MQVLSDLRILEHIGLTRNESIVYVELLKTGPNLARNIARITNMHRTSVYNCLQRLHKKGLVAVSNYNNHSSFEAVNPNKLLSLLKEREERLMKVLPALNKLRDTKLYTKHEVQYFKGKQGLKSVYDDIINTSQDYVGWGPEDKIEKLLKYYFLHYIRSRQKKNIYAKLLYFESSKGKAHTKSPLVNVKYLPKMFYSATAHRVYGDNVAIILLEEEPLCILIRNKAIADAYRKNFHILWDIAKK